MVQNAVELRQLRGAMQPLGTILVIRFSSIGDILLTTPVVRLLKWLFPDCQIDFVVKEEFAELLSANPNISTLYCFSKTDPARSLAKLKREIKTKHYDLIIDLHRNFRSYYLSWGSGAHRVIRYQKGVIRRFLLVKFKLGRQRPVVPIYQRYLNTLAPHQLPESLLRLEIFIPDEMAASVAERYSGFIDHAPGPIIGIAPGAKHATKRWTTEGFEAVIRFFIDQHNARVILFGSAADREFVDQIRLPAGAPIVNAVGQLSLLETSALMRHCHLMLTNDSGLMHLATALKKKVVAIFGSTTEQLGFFPYLTDYIVVQNHSLLCRPCSHIGRQRCPKGHFQCMKDIAAEQVIEAMLKLLSGPTQHPIQ